MLDELQLRNYAQNTIRLYVRTVEDFARRFNCSPDRLGPRRVREYQAELFRKGKSPSTVTRHLAALRFFYVRSPLLHEALSATQKLCALRHANYLPVSLPAKSLLAPSSTTLLALSPEPILCACRVVGCAPQHRLDTPHTHPFPQLNLHRARVHRTHGRPRPNGFTGRAQNSGLSFTAERERASGKALTLIRD